MLLCGCSERNQTRRIITEMIGKQVVLPDSLNLINGNQMEDSENIIKLVGNPAYNASMMELYVKTLKNHYN